MSDEELKQKVERLEKELAEQRKERAREGADGLFGGIIQLIILGIIVLWLFNGGFGEIARLLFWAGLLQK